MEARLDQVRAVILNDAGPASSRARTCGAESRFQSTLWDTVMKAQQGSQDALDRLLADYWKPAYFFIRRKGYDVEAAKNLTQGFLGIFLEKNYLGQVSPERGQFRSFVMASTTCPMSATGR